MATVISQCEVAPAGNATEMSLPLTFYDMRWLFYFPMVPRLLFYRLPISRDTFVETTIPNLMTSLSLTLKHFLPVAGNLVSPSDCSAKPELRYVPGDSVSVTFAESIGDFNSLVAHHPRDVNGFYPFVPRLTEEKSQIVVPVFAVQVTVFPGFGICIGTTHHHVVGDGNTMISFTKAWAMIRKMGGDAEFIAEKSVPIFDRTVVKDPYGAGDTNFEEIMRKKAMVVEPSKSEISTPRINKVRATYIMRRGDIEKLKNLVAATQKIDVSAFTITCAYVWTCLLKAGEKTEENKTGGKTEEDKTGEKSEENKTGEKTEKDKTGEKTEKNRTEYFCCFADCRSRLSPPLPPTYFGNCAAAILVKSKVEVLVGSQGFLIAAKLIGEEIQKRVNDQEWILNGESWLSVFEEAVGQRALFVTGYPRVDIYGADFGWGKPEKVEFVSIDGGNAISLCMCRDFEGDFEVGLAMPRTKIDAFAAIFADSLRNL